MSHKKEEFYSIVVFQDIFKVHHKVTLGTIFVILKDFNLSKKDEDSLLQGTPYYNNNLNISIIRV